MTAAGFSPSQSDTVRVPASGLRHEFAEALDLEASAFEPAVELIAGEAEPPMRRLLAQKLELMRCEIDHEQPAARRQQARSLADGDGWIVEEVQHLMQHHRVG